MNETDAATVTAMVYKLWPKTAWAPEQRTEFTRLVSAIPIDTEQARAALINLSMNSKYGTVRPVEPLNALRGAVNRAKEEHEQQAPEKGKREKGLATDLLLHDLPPDLRMEALLRVDQILKRAVKLSNVGERLKQAARQAEEGDWAKALEHSPFRFEVKTCPAVAKWLEGQELPELDLPAFDKISTTT